MLADREREKYTKAWEIPDYRKFSPGATYAEIFHQIAGPEPVRVVDIGCGDGQGGKALQELGHHVHFLDLVEVAELKPFLNYAIWHWPASVPPWDWGYCCDVMEHLPPEMVGLSLDRIAKRCTDGFFSIGLMPDHFGQYVGEPLHLTVRSFEWWRDFLGEFGEVEEARDLWSTGVYVVRF